MKVCARCKIQKADIEFRLNRKNRDNLHSWCRACVTEYNHTHNKTRKFTKVQREQRSEQGCEWTRGNRRRVKNRRLKRRYGITLDEYEQMIVQQQERCLICGQQKELVVDHDHDTGEVRGLLCRHCNLLVGEYELCPQRWRQIQTYLGLPK